MKKIAIVTTTRADYGILKSLIKKLNTQKDFDVQLLVSGTHLDKKYGLTIDEIKKDDIAITREIHVSSKNKNEKAVIELMATSMTSFFEIFSEIKPDLVFVVGDRFEMFAIAQAAFILKIPLAHIHGGEVTSGALDDGFRHSMSKLSSLHFVSSSFYRERLIRMGEEPSRIFVVGAPALDMAKSEKLLSRNELEEKFNIKFGGKNILMTYHPTTISRMSSAQEISIVAKSLESLSSDIHVIMTGVNCDPGSEDIWGKLIELTTKNPDRFFMVPSFGQAGYFSMLKTVDLVVGNSSSGVIEAPFFNTPSINIGKRQEGRLGAPSILNVEVDELAIIDACNKALDISFKKSLPLYNCPYGSGEAANKIVLELEKIFSSKNVTDSLINKKFYDA